MMVHKENGIVAASDAPFTLRN